MQIYNIRAALNPMTNSELSTKYKNLADIYKITLLPLFISKNTNPKVLNELTSLRYDVFIYSVEKFDTP